MLVYFLYFLGDIFNNDIRNLSGKYDLEITPSDSTFLIWIVIYLWQMAWMGYGLSLLGRQGITGYLYYSPNFMSVWLYIAFIVNNVLNVCWLVVWDREELISAFAVLALTAISCYVCIFTSAWFLHKSYRQLQDNGHVKEIWLVRFLVQNGLGMYATWVTIATLINLGMVLTHSADVDMKVASTVCLAILAFEVVVWFIADLVFLDNHVRYLVTPYVVLVWALSGVVEENYVSAEERNSILAFLLLSASVAALIIKVIALVVRHFQAPLYNDTNKDNQDMNILI